MAPDPLAGHRRHHRHGALSLWVMAWLLDDFAIDGPADALLAGFVVGLVNAVVWPALAVVVVPLSVLTLGLGAIVLDAILVMLVLDQLPGVTLDGFWTGLIVVIGLTAISTMVASALALDDDAWFDRSMARRAASSSRERRCAWHRVRAARRVGQVGVRSGAAIR